MTCLEQGRNEMGTDEAGAPIQTDFHRFYPPIQ